MIKTEIKIIQNLEQIANAMEKLLQLLRENQKGGENEQNFLC